MGSSILIYLSILFGTALVIALLFRTIKFPSIIGFILAGIILGPSGLGLFPETWVSYFIDWGAVLLLFVVGLELSNSLFLKTLYLSVKSGGLLVLYLVIAFTVLCYFFVDINSMLELIVLVAVLSSSSTAVVLNYLHDHSEIETPYGLLSTTVTIIQDLTTLAFLVIISFLSVSTTSAQEGWIGRIASLILGLIVLSIFICGKKIVPSIVAYIAYQGGQDLLTLFALFCAIVGALLAYYLGWSAGLGACFAGVLVGQSDERHQLAAEIQPFHDVIYALFFISLGMSFPLEWSITHIQVLSLIVIGVLLARFILNLLALKTTGVSTRIAILVSIFLLPLSEISFIICREFSKWDYVSLDILYGVTAITTATMVISSILLLYIKPLNKKLIEILSTEEDEDFLEGTQIGPHVVIIGFGLTGENLAKVLKSTGIPFVVIEMNQELAQKAKDMEPAKLIVGDATQRVILNQAELHTAQAVVISLNDPIACRKIVGQIVVHHSHLYILVKTRFAHEIEVLKKLGAKQVISEDFETSIEVVAHVLKHCGVPDNIVEAETIAIRSDGYAMLRGKASSRAGIEEIIRILERTTTQTYYLGEKSFANGKTLAEVDLRKRTGCSVIAVVRAGIPTTSPPSDFVLQANDVLVLVGAHQQIDAARKLLEEPAL